METLRIMSARRVPWFQGLGDHFVVIPDLGGKPVARRLAENSVAFAVALRGERPMRKRCEFLIAADFDVHLLLHDVAVLARGAKIRYNTSARAGVGCPQPVFD